MRAAQIETVPRPVVAIGNEYPTGHQHPAHSHERAQFLFAERGTMLVWTEHGAWMVPPTQGIWIPGGTVHSIHMVGDVATRSVYLDPGVGSRTLECQVVGVGPLLAQLLVAAVDVPTEYDQAGRDGRLMMLLMDEIALAPALPLHVPLPRSDKLAQRCSQFLKSPTMNNTIDDWSRDLGLSRRSFTRLFRHEVGLSFTDWQRRACLLSALPRLSQGERVTTIALDLGYATPNAFTAMFRRMMGAAPSILGRTPRTTSPEVMSAASCLPPHRER
ncbi:helix-turn-helix domain-containing protein [Acidisphaera sp. S103]|uniref:AraC family transcriptional regulator n=1 Tax=Acidisphaera sp. S103 TaxID=1747223 RepID=UPI00131DC521|nr:helix-turn-helix transcriptional regulator [Acidisphaera sp. S103]